MFQCAEAGKVPETSKPNDPLASLFDEEVREKLNSNHVGLADPSVASVSSVQVYPGESSSLPG